MMRRMWNVVVVVVLIVLTKLCDGLCVLNRCRGDSNGVTCELLQRLLDDLEFSTSDMEYVSFLFSRSRVRSMIYDSYFFLS
jgi:hypothetical protein